MYKLIPLILLVGCATEPQPPTIEIQKVEVPIAVLCKTAEPAVPSFNINNVTGADDIFVKTRALLADNSLHRGYEAELLSALRSCK